MAKGKLIIVSGFSGVGKGTVISELRRRHPDEYAFSVSATTREPRFCEEEGKDYYFVDEDEFERMILDHELLEYTRYGYNYYGTPRGPIEKMQSEGKNIILDIEVNGMQQVTANVEKALTVFVIPPSCEELIQRLRGRGTEDEDQVRTRLSRAIQEASFAGEYGCILKNTDIDQCVREFEAFIESGKQDKKTRLENLSLSQEICEGIKRYIKQGD